MRSPGARRGGTAGTSIAFSMSVAVILNSSGYAWRVVRRAGSVVRQV
ncbi:hypothetical protein ABZ568_03370 [Streptomyces olindensis]|uniref:Uncharacterized protein n=1 Tax=Streptomyces olindensis TaxID=358823 RepID=A0ABV2XNB0_9ACTN